MVHPDKVYALLEPLADPVYRQSVSRLIPQEPPIGVGEWSFLGVRTAHIRQVQKRLYASLKSREDYQAALEFTDEAFRRRQYELSGLGVMSFLRLKAHWDDRLIKHIRLWIAQAADWAICDSLGYLLGEMLIRGTVTLDDILDLKDHPSIWGQRMLLSGMVYPLRQGGDDFDRYLETVALYNGRKEKAITKAVSWCLREGSKKHPEAIRAFLEKHGSQLRGSIVREVSTKLEIGVKTVKRKK